MDGHLTNGTISMQVNGLMKLMNGDNTGPINIGNPGKLLLQKKYILRQRANNLICKSFIILHFHSCGDELDFL